MRQDPLTFNNMEVDILDTPCIVCIHSHFLIHLPAFTDVK